MKLTRRTVLLLTSLVLVATAAVVVPALTRFVADPVTLPPGPESPWASRSRPARPMYPYQPQEGQAGKDVVWVPTSQSQVDSMLDLAKVTRKDYVIDLGSGDGRTVIAAARRGARAMGVEFNAELVELSRHNAREAGLADRASFVRSDIFESDFSKATVITLFLLPELNLRLRPALLSLAAGTRIVSNTFTMDDWLPDATAGTLEGCESWCLALLWIVPANVEGTWTLPDGTLTLTQRFQMVAGALRRASGTHAVEGGRLRGTEIGFTVAGATYTGRVVHGTMTGTVERAGRSAAWSATRATR